MPVLKCWNHGQKLHLQVYKNYELCSHYFSDLKCFFNKDPTFLQYVARLPTNTFASKNCILLSKVRTFFIENDAEIFIWHIIHGSLLTKDLRWLLWWINLQWLILVKLSLKNKNNFFAKYHCEIQVHTILVCTLYSIKYSKNRLVIELYIVDMQCGDKTSQQWKLVKSFVRWRVCWLSKCWATC
jgi:hypothetical protein